jgi:hypothetical protein
MSIKDVFIEGISTEVTLLRSVQSKDRKGVKPEPSGLLAKKASLISKKGRLDKEQPREEIEK